ncbi:MAG: Gfo/Idh/MocA family protein [Planctomycetaceae bacterium]
MVDLRFGLIGCGAWGIHHASAIRETPGATLVAVAARSESSQAAAREICPEAAVMADYRQLLARTDLDVVDIAVPTHLHGEIACAALESGRHVLLEKPMAGTLEECSRILTAARLSRRLLAVGFQLRLSGLWGRVEELLREDAIGTPLYCLIELFGGPCLGAGCWRYDRGKVGNWILEEPIHFFDLARWYLSCHGEPTAVTARSNSIDDSRPLLCDNFSAFLDFPDGAYAVITQTLAAFEHYQTVKLTGTRGAIWASWDGSMNSGSHLPTCLLRHFDGRTVTELDCGGASDAVFGLQQQIARMCDAVRGSQPLHADGHDGRRAVELCLAAEESSRLKQTVGF